MTVWESRREQIHGIQRVWGNWAGLKKEGVEVALIRTVEGGKKFCLASQKAKVLESIC